MNSVSPDAAPYLLLFPYLRLEQRLPVGSWELIPRHELTAADAADQMTFDLALQHIALYALPTDRPESGKCGVFARPVDGRIGDSFGSLSAGALHPSVLVALLIMNPEDDEPNSGLRRSTSDNAGMFWHSLNPQGRVAIEFGAVVRTLVTGIRADECPRYIAHVPELHLPSMGSQLDGRLGGAVYGLLVQQSDEARRLRTTIEWLDVAWRNTATITAQVRVMALKSAFEVLLNVGSGAETGARALSDLLDPPGTPPRERHYVTLSGKPRAEMFTDLAWWFKKFADLRNNIAHGREVATDDWTYEGKPHIRLAHRHIFRALRKKVADATGDRRFAAPRRDAIDIILEG